MLLLPQLWYSLPGKWGWSVVRSLSEQLDQLLHDPQNRRLAAGLLPESSDLDKEWLPARALEQAAACRLRRARLFQDGATCPPRRLQVAIRRNTRAFLTLSVQPTPYFSLRPSLCCESKRTPDCCFQEGSGRKWQNCLYITEHHHPLGTGSDQSLLSPAWGDSILRAEQECVRPWRDPHHPSEEAVSWLPKTVTSSCLFFQPHLPSVPHHGSHPDSGPKEPSTKPLPQVLPFSTLPHMAETTMHSPIPTSPPLPQEKGILASFPLSRVWISRCPGLWDMNRGDVWHFWDVPLKEEGMLHPSLTSSWKTGKVVSDPGPCKESNTVGWWDTEEEAGPGQLLRPQQSHHRKPTVWPDIN